MFKNNSRSSTTENNFKRCLFNGELGKWPKQREEFVRLLRINKCAEYALGDRIPVVAGDHNFAVMIMADGLIEDQFIFIRTDTSEAAVTVKIDELLETRKVRFNLAKDRLRRSDISNRRYKVEREKLQQVYEADVDKIREQRTQIQSELIADLGRWEKLKSLHDDKVASLIHCFSYLGPEPQSQIKDLLSNLEFRAALRKIDDHYGVTKGGQIALQNLYERLGKMRFNPRKMSVWKHIRDVKDTCDEIAMFSKAKSMDDAFVLGYILKSVKASDDKEFVDACKWIQNANHTLEQAETRFQNVQMEWDNEHMYKGQSSDQPPRVDKKRNSQSANLSETAHAAKATKGTEPIKTRVQAVCGKCKRLSYHKEDSCWLGTKCDTCGGVHPTERHDFATRFSPKAEEKGPGKKVHIAPLYSKDKK